MDKEVRSKPVIRNGISATLYTIFVPLTLNSGHPMSQMRLNWAQDRILRYAGGLTMFSLGIGFWVNHTRLYKDRVLPVQVVTATSSEADKQFARLSTEMALVLEQEQIFLFAQRVYLVEPAPLHGLVGVAELWDGSRRMISLNDDLVLPLVTGYQTFFFHWNGRRANLGSLVCLVQSIVAWCWTIRESRLDE